MYFTLNIVPFRMPSGVSIVSTDWEFSDDKDMTNILRKSYNDTDNLKSIIFKYPMEAGRTYYGRSKCLLTTGPLNYGPVSKVTVDENQKINVTTPSPINTPTLQTAFDKNEHPHTCFTIFSDDYEVIGNSKLKRSHWLITELLTGRPVLSKSSELERFELFCNIKLDFNKQYLISLIYEGDNGDFSPRGSLIISTSDNLIKRGGRELITVEEDFDLTKYDVTAPNVQHEWYLYDDKTNLLNTNMTQYGLFLETGITNIDNDGTNEVKVVVPYSEYESGRSDFVVRVTQADVNNNDGTDKFIIIYGDGSSYTMEFNDAETFPEITEDSYFVISTINDKHDVTIYVDNGFTNVTTIGSYTIKKEWLKNGRTYLLQGRTINNLRPENKSNFFAFTTIGNLNYGLPGAFPYKLGQGGDSGYISIIDNDKE